MVVPTDVQLTFVAAAVFADFGGKYILAEHQKSPEHSRLAYCKYRLRALLFPTLFVGPVALTFMLAWPAWETQYWSLRMDQTLGNGLTSLVAGIFLAALVLAALLGSWFGFRCVVIGRRWLLRLVYLALFAFTIFIVFIQWPAPVRLGTASQFQSDPTVLPYIWKDNTFFIMFIVLSVYCVLPLVFFFFSIRRESASSS